MKNSPNSNDQPYFIAGAKSLNSLGLECIDLCENGWEPLGGPNFVPPGSGTDADGMFYQAFKSLRYKPVVKVKPVQFQGEDWIPESLP